MRHSLMALLGLAMLAAPASAQLLTDPMDSDRYHVVEVEGAVLRIERQTGDISECRQESSGWVCRLSADDRLAYEAEINRLDAEVDRLAAELAARPQADGTSGSPPAPADGESARERLNLPTEDDLDAVMDTAEDVMRRFVDVVQRLRADIEAERAQ